MSNVSCGLLSISLSGFHFLIFKMKGSNEVLLKPSSYEKPNLCSDVYVFFLTDLKISLDALERKSQELLRIPERRTGALQVAALYGLRRGFCPVAGLTL